MNDAHFHLIVNHVPLLALVIGLLVLFAGFFLKKSDIILTALGIFIFASLTSILAFYTGEGAEDVVENLPGISEVIIHEHEEFAEAFLTVTLVLGGFSIIAFIAEVKKIKYSKPLIVFCLLLAIACGIVGVYVGITGGEIIHTEI